MLIDYQKEMFEVIGFNGPTLPSIQAELERDKPPDRLGRGDHPEHAGPADLRCH